uniref:C2H2-type domain-containing protein n=1 Tax=Meloidogyne incognita TaxID=6306 RepID=A0A914M504_MELIC
MKKENSKLSPINSNQDISINLTKNNDNSTNYLANDNNNIIFSSSNFLSKESLLNSLVASSSVPSTSSPIFSPTSNSSFNYCGSNTGGGNILARNSTKTLKCPKCNWHYKYQETLEIHMKEKHADQEVLCLFCLENQTHPKLARGETYSCGYKPYRCELCKYSTTTKGNLSIHMQSDKHLHALQEIPQSLA